MNKRAIIAKIAEGLILAATAILVAFLLAPVDNAGSIIKQYGDMTERPNKSFGKKLNFLQNYTVQSGNNELALNLGLTTDDVEKFRHEQLSDDIKQSDNVVDYQYTTMTKLAQADALVTDVRNNTTHYREALQITNYNLMDFYWESQGKSHAWSAYKPNGNSMKSQGCFYFAVAAAIGALNDDACTVEQVLTMLGGDIIVDDNGLFVVNNNPIPNLSGNTQVIEKVLKEKFMYDFTVIPFNHITLSSPEKYVHWKTGKELTTYSIVELAEGTQTPTEFRNLIDVVRSLGETSVNATDLNGKRSAIIAYAANWETDNYKYRLEKTGDRDYYRTGSSSKLFSVQNEEARDEEYMANRSVKLDSYNRSGGNHWFVILGREGNNMVTLCLSTGEEGRVPISEFQYLKYCWVITEDPESFPDYPN